MTEFKPHHGRLADWHKVSSFSDKGTGFCISARALDHPEFKGRLILTSYVISYDEKTGEIETRNSRYTLVDKDMLLEEKQAIEIVALSAVIDRKRNEVKAALEVLLTMLPDSVLVDAEDAIKGCWRDDKNWQFKEEIAEALDNQARYRGEFSKR